MADHQSDVLKARLQKTGQRLVTPEASFNHCDNVGAKINQTPSDKGLSRQAMFLGNGPGRQFNGSCQHDGALTLSTLNPVDKGRVFPQPFGDAPSVNFLHGLKVDYLAN
jgi:hypothetical protein